MNWPFLSYDLYDYLGLNAELKLAHVKLKSSTSKFRMCYMQIALSIAHKLLPIHCFIQNIIWGWGSHSMANMGGKHELLAYIIPLFF